MKSSPMTIPELYANWIASSWSLLLGRVTAVPSAEPAPHAAQAAAEQEWEDEGGSVKLPEQPQAEQAPKLPL
jgi:hypothetical protein